MLISEMTEQECRAALASSSFGRLACSLNDQPYIVPLYFAYEAGYFYAMATLGQKIEWMRENPKVCFQVDQIEGDSRWVSVVANGHFEELREPQCTDERAHAHKLLSARSHWWEPPLAERQLKSQEELIAPVIFRIRILSMTGLRAA
jgi:nitroimidazol reductase NimA-like FMN-containing flavoprotein (pyridoxamine 5'-phosphate oxidase superfamily)